MIRTRRWNDPPGKGEGDGARILICRYRPRGVKKSDETWDEWAPDLGPSRALLADYHEGLVWKDYERRYLEEMQAPKSRYFIRAIAGRAAAGERITLLCSSACTDESRCHRTLLRKLIEECK